MQKLFFAHWKFYENCAYAAWPSPHRPFSFTRRRPVSLTAKRSTVNNDGEIFNSKFQFPTITQNSKLSNFGIYISLYRLYSDFIFGSFFRIIFSVFCVLFRSVYCLGISGVRLWRKFLWRQLAHNGDRLHQIKRNENSNNNKRNDWSWNFKVFFFLFFQPACRPIKMSFRTDKCGIE